MCIQQTSIYISDLIFYFVPSHIGINGNDMADSAAKEAALLISPPFQLTQLCDVMRQTFSKIQSLKNGNEFGTKKIKNTFSKSNQN